MSEYQGRCGITQTERFRFDECKCGTYVGNLGPCKTYLPGADPERCVYCDHKLVCHEAVMTTPPVPQVPSAERREKIIHLWRSHRGYAGRLGLDTGHSVEMACDDFELFLSALDTQYAERERKAVDDARSENARLFHDATVRACDETLGQQKHQIRRLTECLAFFASVIKSGEPWTDACQAEYDKARALPIEGDG